MAPHAVKILFFFVSSVSFVCVVWEEEDREGREEAVPGPWHYLITGYTVVLRCPT